MIKKKHEYADITSEANGGTGVGQPLNMFNQLVSAWLCEMLRKKAKALNIDIRKSPFSDNLFFVTRSSIQDQMIDS